MAKCITALCPTYGRFELLRDAVACFLLQTYKPRHLIILNDAPEPITLSGNGDAVHVPGATIEIWNVDSRYETLGHKRQALLTGADSDYVAHWDDDDWYMPWHLQQCMKVLKENEARGDNKVQCIKPRGAWWCIGARDDLIVKGPRHNVFEGQMAFDRRAALELGGYSEKDSGQAKDLMQRFKSNGSFVRFEPDLVSYCYRWGHGGGHVSACGDGDSWADKNENYGADRVLVPNNLDPAVWAAGRMQRTFQCLVEKLPKRQDEIRQALDDAHENMVVR